MALAYAVANGISHAEIPDDPYARFLRRPAYAALAALLLAATAFEAATHGLGYPRSSVSSVRTWPWPSGPAPGWRGVSSIPRAVRLYNALHAFWAPVALLVLAGLGDVGLGWFVVGLAWAAHIAVDRAVGYGFRNAAGFQR